MAELGSLSQSARESSLKGARGILIFVGVLTLLINGGLALFARQFIESQIPPGVVADPVLVDELVQSVRVNGVGFALLGVAFLVGAAKIYAYPVPVTVICLILYIGGAAIDIMADPTAIGRQWLKIIFIIALAKAVGTAMAYERERSAAAEEDEPATDAFSA